MAFIGILIADIIIFVLLIAVVCGTVALTVWGVAAIISGIVLSRKGSEAAARSKKKIIGIGLIVAGTAVFIPVGYLALRILQMFR